MDSVVFACPGSPSEFEALVGHVAGVAMEDVRGPYWRDIYLQVSRQILQAETEGRASTAEADSSADAVLIRALVYAQRSWMVLRDLLPVEWLASRRVWDFGAGTGPGALWSIHAGARSITSYEAGRTEREWMTKLRSASGVRDWSILPGARTEVISEAGEGDRFLFLHSLREISGGNATRAARLLEPGLHRGAGFFLLEPGTQTSSQFLMEVRDRLRAYVEAPCRGAEACPRRHGPAWCHFTWRAGLGPRATAVLQSAGRKANLLHFSYLRLGPNPVPPRDHRLLEIDLRGRRQLELRFCGPDGEISVGIPPKPKDAYKAARGLVAGSLLRDPSDESGRFANGKLRHLAPELLEPPRST